MRVILHEGIGTLFAIFACDVKVKLLKSLQVCRSDKNLILVVNYFNTLPLTMKDKSEMKT